MTRRGNVHDVHLKGKEKKEESESKRPGKRREEEKKMEMCAH